MLRIKICFILYLDRKLNKKMQSNNETNESVSLDDSESSEKILYCITPPIQPIDVYG